MALTSVGEFYLKNKVKGLNNMQIAPSSRKKSHELIIEWQTFLGISDWNISCQSISEMQVTDSLKGDTNGHEFVGIAINFEARKGIIYHTRTLAEDDIIHELLHVRFPLWSEEKVNYWTNLLEHRQFLKIV